jgi:hypothetical protein
VAKQNCLEIFVKIATAYQKGEVESVELKPMKKNLIQDLMKKLGTKVQRKPYVKKKPAAHGADVEQKPRLGGKALAKRKVQGEQSKVRKKPAGAQPEGKAPAKRKVQGEQGEQGKVRKKLAREQPEGKGRPEEEEPKDEGPKEEGPKEEEPKEQEEEEEEPEEEEPEEEAPEGVPTAESESTHPEELVHKSDPSPAVC